MVSKDRLNPQCRSPKSKNFTPKNQTNRNKQKKKNEKQEEPEAERNEAGSPRDGRRTRLAAAGLLTPENLQTTSRDAVPRFHQFPPVEAGGNACRDSGRCQLGAWPQGEELSCQQPRPLPGDKQTQDEEE